MIRAALLLALLAAAPPAGAAEIAIGPGADLRRAIAAAAPGDTLRLAPGDYGRLVIENARFDPPLTIAAAPGTARFSRLAVRGSAGLRIDGLTVRSDGNGDDMVLVQRSRDITLSRFDVASADDTSGWNAAAWKANARHGVRLEGNGLTLRDSHVHSVRHGVQSLGDGALIEGNLIEEFIADGLRALGDDSVYRGNVIRGCIKVDGHHDDGIQSYSVGPDGKPGTGIVRNVLIEGNTILNSPPARPARNCQLQGIGFFDGIFENLTIRDNRVEVNHWHGITVMGARGVTIEGNTVLDTEPGRPGPPWIAITPHKDGRPPEAGLIADNVIQRDPELFGLNAHQNEFLRAYPGVERRGDRIHAGPRP